MVYRIIVALCGIVIIVHSFKVKDDKGNKYTNILKDKYEEISILKYLNELFYAELLLGLGIIIEAIFNEGIGYGIGVGVMLLGVILYFIALGSLKKKKLPYRNENKKRGNRWKN